MECFGLCRSLTNLTGRHCFRLFGKSSSRRFIHNHSESVDKRLLKDLIEELYSSEELLYNYRPEQGKYYFANRTRYAYPRLMIHSVSVPREFVGRNIVNFAAKNLQVLSPEEVEANIENGFIRVNRKVAHQTFKLKYGQRITFIWHNHETPVIALPPKILFQDENVIVIDKPPGIPTHSLVKSCRINSLVDILKIELNISCSPLFRLDAGTSGLIMMSSVKQVRREFHSDHVNQNIEKKYLAEVIGNFPDKEITVDVPLYVPDNAGVVLVDKVFGKPSRTIFRKIKTKSDTSVVESTLVTGRSHQIRVHLQYLGFPIVNDIIYSSKEVFGPNLGKGGDIRDYNPNMLKKVRQQYFHDYTDKSTDVDRVWNFYTNPDWISYIKENPYNPKYDLKYDDCSTCSVENWEPVFRKFMHLHAFSYKTTNYNFSTDLPFWFD